MTLDFVFKPVGKLHSYRAPRTLSSSSGLADEQSTSDDDSYDQDWALVRIELSIYSPNSVQLPVYGGKTTINEYILTEDLVHDDVYVVSGTGGVLTGYLTPEYSYWMLEDSYFEVRTVILDKQLSKGLLSARKIVIDQ